MSRFYTHVLNGTGFAEDEEGQEFADLDAARCAAVQSAAGIVAEELSAGRHQVSLELYIHDERGARLATLPVTAAVTGLD